MPAKRKRSLVVGAANANMPQASEFASPVPKRQASLRTKAVTNPDQSSEILDGKVALRASPDAEEEGEALDIQKIQGPAIPHGKINSTNGHLEKKDRESPLSDLRDETPTITPVKKLKKTPTKSSIAAKKGSDEIKAFRAEQAAKKAEETKVKKEEYGDEWDKRQDPDGDEVGSVEDADTLKLEAARPPPVNSDYLPLPWKGRLGYVSIASYFYLVVAVFTFFAGLSQYLLKVL